MLKSQAPSRQKQVKGRLALASTKRQKTATPPLGRSSNQISAETTGTGPLPPRTDTPTIVQGRWPTPTPVKVSVDGQEDSSSQHQPQQQQTSRGLQDHQCFENKTKNASSPTPGPSNVVETDKHTRAAMNCVSAAAAAADIAASPARRMKARGQKRAAATAAATEASGNGDVEWRVPPPSSNLPYRDTGASSSIGSSRSSRSGKDRSRAQAGAPTAKRLPAECSSGSGSRSSSGRASRSRNDNGSSKARPSCSTSRTGRASSPVKNYSSSATTAVATKKEDQGEKDEEAGKKEEEEGELPPCPYPGHKNVSWTCRGCGGARHHLTSRSAMEPLQRVHGFKVQRVPNDGDCFFSSIKAALPAGMAIDRARGFVSGDAATATEAGAVAGKELTVAEMREWVAEEAGQEQLEFYILQAGANPMDRWLDFVRPLDERIPSDDEEEDEDENEDEEDEDEEEDEEEDSYKDDAASAPSSQSQSQSQSQASQPKNSAVTSHKSSSQSRLPAPIAPVRDPTESGPNIEGGSGGERTEIKKGKGGSGEGKKSGSAGRMSASRGHEAVSNEDDAGAADTVEVMASTASSDRTARRLERHRNREIALFGLARSTVMTGTDASTNKNTTTPNPSSSPPRAPPAPLATGSTPRKSARLGRGQRTPDPWRVGNDSGEEEEERGGNETENDEDEEGGEEEEEGEAEGLPVVRTVEELRRFVRLEGSIVGHDNCMWADTFAHHVLSRKLKITILFVDMEREKNAWPYRVLARTATDSDNEEDERFVVLKREPSHFVLLRTVPSQEEKDGAVASNGGGAGGGGGGGRAATSKRRGDEGQACFSRSDLPDVVRRLWQIEPVKKKVKAPATSGK